MEEEELKGNRLTKVHLKKPAIKRKSLNRILFLSHALTLSVGTKEGTVFVEGLVNMQNIGWDVGDV